MSVLPVGQKPIVMPSYPHMMSEDVTIWSKYLAEPVTPIKNVWYDIHVGGAVQVPGGPDSLEGRISLALTRKRIDVVCRVGGGYWVVEVKPYGSMLALGQVLAYSRLFRVEFNPPGQVIPAVVCGNADLDLVDDFQDAGVLLIAVS